MLLVGYIRVSTGKQLTSGLGLEAQREAVERFASQSNLPLLTIYTEQESGAVHRRPQLTAALELCRKHRATLLIARLDRLSRSLAFIAQLLEAGVDVRCADMPEANRLLLQLLAVFAEHERGLIRDRTRAALAAAKARGVQLGRNGARLAAMNKEVAYKFACETGPHIEAIRDDGHQTLQSIARELNARGVACSGGGLWHPTTVSRVLRRLRPCE